MKRHRFRRARSDREISTADYADLADRERDWKTGKRRSFSASSSVSIRASSAVRFTPQRSRNINRGLRDIADRKRDWENRKEKVLFRLFIRFNPRHPRLDSPRIVAARRSFGPVLNVMRIEDLDAAIATANKSAYGNGAAIFTQSGQAAREFKHRIKAGMVGISVAVPASMAMFPFTGWADSFYGGLHIQGREGVQFYTQQKSSPRGGSGMAQGTFGRNDAISGGPIEVLLVDRALRRAMLRSALAATLSSSDAVTPNFPKPMASNSPKPFSIAAPASTSSDATSPPWLASAPSSSPSPSSASAGRWERARTGCVRRIAIRESRIASNGQCCCNSAVAP